MPISCHLLKRYSIGVCGLENPEKICNIVTFIFAIQAFDNRYCDYYFWWLILVTFARRIVARDNTTTPNGVLQLSIYAKLRVIVRRVIVPRVVVWRVVVWRVVALSLGS